MSARKLALGLHVGHDRAASIVEDGELVAHLPEERVDRRKGSDSHSLPFGALRRLLEFQRLTLSDFRAIGISYASVDSPERLTDRWRDDLGQLGTLHCPVVPVAHHLSHAFAAFHTSPFDEALVLVADGGGDIVGDQLEAESLFLADASGIRLLERRLQDFPSAQLRHLGAHSFDALNPVDFDKRISLGRKYTQITYNLGFGPGQDGKTMALAAFGNTLIDYPHNDQGLQFNLSYRDVLEDIARLWRQSDMPLGTFRRRFRADIAATGQAVLERIALPMIAQLARRHRRTQFCLAGGIFLNCVLNHKVLEQTPVERVHIVPAAGDDGESIGAAFFAYQSTFNGPSRGRGINPYLGIAYDDDEIVGALAALEWTASFVDDATLARRVAEYIAEGRIVGVVRGRSEVGPRALCHRSLLGDPRTLTTRQTLDRRIKHREPFQPYAPVVKDDAQFRFFDLCQPSPFMLLAAPVKAEYLALLPAITHIDGTARVQAVSEHDEPFIYAILSAFEQLTGMPVLLNTSFNDAGEPIVETPSDALSTFAATAIDVLVLGNRLIVKQYLEDSQPISC